MQAATNYSVDIVLAFILMVAGVIGAQYGVRVGQKLRGEQLRALLGAAGSRRRPAPCRRAGRDAGGYLFGGHGSGQLMRRLRSCSLLFVTACRPSRRRCCCPGRRRADRREGLEIGTSTSEIAITSDFRGADLTIFGAVTNTDDLLLAIGQYDVVVRSGRAARRRHGAPEGARASASGSTPRSMTFDAGAAFLFDVELAPASTTSRRRST